MAYFPGIGAFEQLFGSERGMPGGGGGMLKLRFDWYITSCTAVFVDKCETLT